MSPAAYYNRNIDILIYIQVIERDWITLYKLLNSEGPDQITLSSCWYRSNVNRLISIVNNAGLLISISTSVKVPHVMNIY